MDLLSDEIAEAATQAGYHPTTGEHFTLAEVIERHARRPERERTTVFNGKREVEVPVDCPVPSHLIESSWCDWADGWHLILRGGFAFSEAPGPLDPEYRRSQAWRDSKPFGWHLEDVDKGHETVAFAAEKDPIAGLPTTQTMIQAWKNAERWFTDHGVCAYCLGARMFGELPCPECNVDPKPKPGAPSVWVPMDHAGLRDQAASQLQTFWRYAGRDWVVAEHLQSPEDPEVIRWVKLVRVSPSKADALRRETQTCPPLGEERAEFLVWDDDSVLSPWARGEEVLTFMQPAGVRLWRKSLLVRVAVHLGLAVLLVALAVVAWAWPLP